jgi:hypothetical protein
MVRFSNSKLKQTQYIVNGITPVTGSTTSIIPRIPAHATRAFPNIDASRITRTKASIGVSSTLHSLVNYPDTDVELGVVYSNGFRYQYLDFLATTSTCTQVIPDTVVTVQEQTDDGPIYVDELISGRIIVTAFVGEPVVPPLPKDDIRLCIQQPPLKVKPSNNAC